MTALLRRLLEHSTNACYPYYKINNGVFCYYEQLARLLSSRIYPPYLLKCLVTFRRKVLLPSSEYSTLNTGTARFSETSVNIDKISRRHTPEDSNLHSHRYENFNSNKYCLYKGARICMGFGNEISALRNW
jgi:hypothetical protein